VSKGTGKLEKMKLLEIGKSSKTSTVQIYKKFIWTTRGRFIRSEILRCIEVSQDQKPKDTSNKI
jgi:hypothetical protein